MERVVTDNFLLVGDGTPENPLRLNLTGLSTEKTGCADAAADADTDIAGLTCAECQFARIADSGEVMACYAMPPTPLLVRYDISVLGKRVAVGEPLYPEVDAYTPACGMYRSMHDA